MFSSHRHRVGLAELLEEGRAAEPEEHPLEAEGVVLLAHVAHLGDHLVRGRARARARGRVGRRLGVGLGCGMGMGRGWG